MLTKILSFVAGCLWVSRRICLLCLSGFTPILCQAQVLDQFHNRPDIAISAFSAGGLAQSFKQNAGSVAGAGAYVFGGDGFPAAVEIALWDGLPNAAGQLLVSGSATASADAWLDVFWSPVRVVSGNTYYLVFSGGRNRGIAGDVTNGYANGQVFANNFEPFPGFDFAFRTYAAVVPEPAAWMLLVLGLATVGCAARRQFGRMR